MSKRRVLQFPTPRLRRDEVISDLDAGRSVVWKFPAAIDLRDVIEQLTAEIELAGLGRPVEIQLTADERPCVQVYTELTGEVPQGLPTIEELFALNSRPRVLLLSGWDALNGHAREQWCRFLDDFAAAVDRRMELPPSVVRTVLPMRRAGSKLPQTPHIVTRYYWAWLSMAEMRLFGRSLALEQGFTETRTRWVTMVDCELAGTDTDLLMIIVERLPRVESVDDYLPVLREYGSRRKWTREQLLNQKGLVEFLSGQPYATSSDGLLPSNTPIFSSGVVYETPEYGSEVHPAALAQLGLVGQLRHRVWRGQVATLLPVLDQARRCISQLAPDSLVGGEDHGVYEEVTYDYDELIHWLRDFRSVGSNYSDLYHHAQQLKTYRNMLAHYRCLSYGDFQGLERSLRAVARQGNGSIVLRAM